MKVQTSLRFRLAPFPALGVQDDTLADLTEHPDRGFTTMIAMKKTW